MHLLARSECWQTNVRAAVAAECVSQVAVPATSYLSLHGEVDFRKIVVGELHSLHRGNSLVGAVPTSLIILLQAIRQTAAAILTSTASSAGLWAAFWSCCEGILSAVVTWRNSIQAGGGRTVDRDGDLKL